jgi:hypothetical protein
MEGAHREGVVAASALAPSMVNFGTGVDKRRWGAVVASCTYRWVEKRSMGERNGCQWRSALFEAGEVARAVRGLRYGGHHVDEE